MIVFIFTEIKLAALTQCMHKQVSFTDGRFSSSRTGEHSPSGRESGVPARGGLAHSRVEGIARISLPSLSAKPRGGKFRFISQSHFFLRPHFIHVVPFWLFVSKDLTRMMARVEITECYIPPWPFSTRKLCKVVCRPQLSVNRSL